MSDPQLPKIEFPCPDYPVKVLGDAGNALYALVIDVMERHAAGFEAARITVKDSRNGRYQSLTVWITATGEPQLRAINDELRASGIVKMVM